MSVMVRRARTNFNDDWEPFWDSYAVCRVDGLTLDEDGKLTQADVIGLEDLELSGQKATEGVVAR